MKIRRRNRKYKGLRPETVKKIIVIKTTWSNILRDINYLSYVIPKNFYKRFGITLGTYQRYVHHIANVYLNKKFIELDDPWGDKDYLLYHNKLIHKTLLIKKPENLNNKEDFIKAMLSNNHFKNEK